MRNSHVVRPSSDLMRGPDPVQSTHGIVLIVRQVTNYLQIDKDARGP